MIYNRIIFVVEVEILFIECKLIRGESKIFTMSKSHIEMQTLVRSNRLDTHSGKEYHTARLTPLLGFHCLLLFLHLSMVHNNDALQISFSSLKVKLFL